MRNHAFSQVGGLFLPVDFPDMVGLGCPKCDDHELVPASAANQANDKIQVFLKKHANCGKLDQLERRGGELGVTGVLDPRGGS